MLLAERFPQRDLEEMFANLRKAGAPYGITFRDRTRTSNSRLALMAAEFAVDHGKASSFHDRIFKAYFEEGQDIGQMDVVLQAAAAAGLDTAELSAALKDGRYLERLLRVQEEAGLKMIRSVPTFIVNDTDRIVGAQPLSKFRELLRLVEAEAGAGS